MKYFVVVSVAVACVLQGGKADNKNNAKRGILSALPNSVSTSFSVGSGGLSFGNIQPFGGVEGGYKSGGGEFSDLGGAYRSADNSLSQQSVGNFQAGASFRGDHGFFDGHNNVPSLGRKQTFNFVSHEGNHQVSSIPLGNVYGGHQSGGKYNSDISLGCGYGNSALGPIASTATHNVPEPYPITFTHPVPRPVKFSAVPYPVKTPVRILVTQPPGLAVPQHYQVPQPATFRVPQNTPVPQIFPSAGVDANSLNPVGSFDISSLNAGGTNSYDSISTAHSSISSESGSQHNYITLQPISSSGARNS